MNSLLKSPITGSERVTLLEEIPVPWIRRFYEHHLGLDVGRFFVNLDRVSIYRCDDSGYEFYWPPSSAGDEAFYSALAEQDWYYDERRWEHDTATAWCGDAADVLDVGCGSGSFLERVRAAWPDCHLEGLELSGRALTQARSRGLEVHATPIEDFARGRPASFDVVSAFQVLEHLSEPRSFLDGMVSAVRPGGRILIGVPNNDGALSETTSVPSYALNMPPHHMGRWRPESLARLTEALPLELVRIEEEPFDPRWVERMAYASVARALGGGRLAGLAWRMGVHHVVAKLRRDEFMSLTGHSILAEFRRLDGPLDPGGD